MVEPVDIARHGTGLDVQDRAALKLLARLSQTQLLATWPGPGVDADGKRRLLAQLRELDVAYPGGLTSYLDNARRLLAAQKQQQSPYEGFVPRVPEGFRLAFESDAFAQAEARGLQHLGRVAYVLVGGGLGERLGYSGIKVALPAETATGRCFLELYARQIRAFEALGTGHAGRCPLCIMTSDDTHDRTRELLESHDRFGLEPGQVTLLKQAKVPSLVDDRPSLTLSPDDPYQLDTKPHGHGDVHTLLHQSGLARRWREQGVEWVVMFQDTNGLALHPLPAVLGISQQHQLDVNSVAVPRRAGEAVGGIARLEKGGESLTINVEYSQLDGLLRAAGHAEGDVADETGYSPYPGNVNLLVFRLAPYVSTLERSGGAMPEFVNPKYADETRTTFSKPTRLECMMQDYPRLLGPEARVGFTQLEREVCFSAAKNDLATAGARQKKGLPPEAASIAEADLYALYRRYLERAGARIETGPASTFAGVDVTLFPIVVLSPSLTADPATRLANFSGLRLTARSSLVLLADEVEIDGLELDGALVVCAPPGKKARIHSLKVHNAGWEARPVGPDEGTEADRIRGFRLVRHETETIEVG